MSVVWMTCNNCGHVDSGPDGAMYECPSCGWGYARLRSMECRTCGGGGVIEGFLLGTVKKCPACDGKARGGVAVRGEEAAAMTSTGAERKQSTLFLAGELIRSLQHPAAFWDVFKRVKYDTADSDGYDGERIVIVVAKGAEADRLAEQYEASGEKKPQ